MAPETIDRLFLIAADVVPIALILAFQARGIAYGAVWHWGILIVADKYLDMADPTREAQILDGMWILFGWIWAVFCCAAIYGVYRAGAYAV